MESNSTDIMPVKKNLLISNHLFLQKNNVFLWWSSILGKMTTRRFGGKEYPKAPPCGNRLF